MFLACHFPCFDPATYAFGLFAKYSFLKLSNQRPQKYEWTYHAIAWYKHAI